MQAVEVHKYMQYNAQYSLQFINMWWYVIYVMLCTFFIINLNVNSTSFTEELLPLTVFLHDAQQLCYDCKLWSDFLPVLLSGNRKNTKICESV